MVPWVGLWSVIMTIPGQTLSHCFSYVDPEGGGDRGSGPVPSLKITKNIGFLSNTGLDLLKNHKVTEPAFNVGPTSARQRTAI